MSNKEKFKELFDLSLKSLETEHQRFLRFDEKANKYIAAMTAIIGAFSLMASWIYNNFIPTSNKIEMVIIGLMLLIFILLLFAWWKLFNVIKVRDISVFPINSNVLDFYYKNELVDIHYNFSKKNINELAAKRKQSKEKSDLLNSSFKLIKVVFYLFILLLFLIFFHKIAYTSNSSQKPVITIQLEGEKFMCKNDQQDDSTANDTVHDTANPVTQDPIPRDLENVPDFDIISEGVDHDLNHKNNDTSND